MNWKKQLSIREFSRLTGIKPENLRFYDRIGLLSPETRGENNYRYYSRHQLSTAYLVTTLRSLGVGIADIKDYAAQRTPESTLALFAQQEARIRAEIRQLEENQFILHLYHQLTQESVDHGLSDCFITQRAEEPLLLCPPLLPGTDEDEGMIAAYAYAEAQGIHLGFPQGTLVTQDALRTGQLTDFERYYFKVDRGGNAVKPGGLYAVTYGLCSPWTTEPLYHRLLDFLQREHWDIRGDAYEDYLAEDTGELGENGCVRVEIPVVQR